MLLSIVMLLLRIIGIILLILLAIILLVLLVPIRYWARADAPELRMPDKEARVSWFLRAILVLITFVDDNLIYELKIFGFTVKSNSPEYLAKQEEKRKKKEEKEKAKQEKAKEEAPQEPVKEEESKPEKTPEKEPAEEKPAEEEAVSEEPASKEEILADQAVHEQALKKEEESLDKEELEIEEYVEKQNPISKFIDAWEKMHDKIDSLLEKKERAEELYDKLNGEHLIRKSLMALQKLLKHILPQKLTGYMKFGFDDPAVTGYATGFAATLYPVYGRTFTLEPDFYETCFKANLEGSGRIRLGYLLYIGIWLLLDKYVRRLIKYIRKKKI